MAQDSNLVRDERADREPSPRPMQSMNTSQRPWPEWLIAGSAVFLSALLYVIAFPPFNLAEGIYVFAVPLLLWLFRPRPARAAAAAVVGWGLLSWLALIVWLRHVTYGGYFVASLLLALYFSLWFLAAWWALPRLREGRLGLRLAGITALAALWVLHEYARGFVLTGFPWLPLAASHWERPLLLQLSAWTGAYGVSFILIFFNLGLAFYVDRLLRFYGQGWRRFCPEFFIALALLLVAGFGSFRLAHHSSGEQETIFNAAFVQPYIPQTVKWEPEKTREILGAIERTTFWTKDLPLRPDLVLWPEAVTPLPVVGNPDMQRWVERIASEMEAPLFIGSVGVLRGEKDDWFNGILAIDPEEGLLPHHYSKRKLVPFGEYVPFRAALGWLSKIVPLEGSFAPGESAGAITVSVAGRDLRLGPLVCYEDVFPRLARATVREGADVLIVVSNNGWYGEEAMPFQHATHSVLRAVETRRPVLRSGNGGWSGWIDEYGVIRDVLVDEEGSIFFRGGSVYPIARDSAWADRESFYVRHGDWFVAACGLFVLGAGFGPLRPGRRMPR